MIDYLVGATFGVLAASVVISVDTVQYMYIRKYVITIGMLCKLKAQPDKLK